MPLARRVQNEYWKFLLDAGTVVVGGGLAIWYLVIVPSSTYELDGFWGTFLALAYPIASMLLLLGVVTAFMRRPAQTNSGTPALLLTGLPLYLVSDLSHRHHASAGRVGGHELDRRRCTCSLHRRSRSRWRAITRSRR